MIDQVWKNFDSSAKDALWFRRILDDIRQRKQWLRSPSTYQEVESYARGEYSVAFAKKLFDTFNQPIESLNIQFEPIDLMTNRINSIVSMIEKTGFSPKAQTTDPTARDKKDADIDLLKAEAELKGFRQQMGQSLGLNKPLPISSEDDFSSDVSPIEKMGLDITNPIDEEFFRNYLQRQVWEIALEVGAEHYMSQNEYNEKLKLLTADLINHNCAAAQVVVNSYSGEPMLTYLYPSSAYTLLAKQNDGKDAIGKGWEKNVTVREIIALMGKDITVDNLLEILSQLNTNGNTNYQGIWMYGNRVDTMSGFSYPMGVPKDNCCEWQQFLNITASLGYLEVKSQNSDLFVHKNINGNINTVKESYDYNAPKNMRKVNSVSEIEKDSDIFLEYKFYDVTYKGYYLPFTNMVFGFGKLPLAVRFGTTNELTDFSIITQKIKGKSMTEKCIPFIKHIFSMWCRLQHFINESRPSGESWDIDVVRELSQEIIGTSGSESKIMEVLKVLQNNTNTVHKSMKTIDGQPIGGDGDPVKQRVRGIDPTVTQLYDMIQRDKNQIVEITGVSDVLLATSSTQAGLGVSQLALQQSLNTIYYIQSALQKMFSDACFNFCQKIQYIVNENKSAEAYKSITRAIGERNVQALKLLGTSPASSYSIYIEWGLNQIQREQLDKLTELLVQSKMITAAQAFSVRDVKSYKIAAALLTYYENKTIQSQQQSLSQQSQSAMAAEQQKSQLAMQEILAKNKGMTDVATINGEYGVKIEQIKAGNKIEVTDKKEIGKHIQTDTKHNQEIQKTLLQNHLDSVNQQSEVS